MPGRPLEVGHISECSVGEVRLLSKILQVLPDDAEDTLRYFDRTHNAIEELPTRLKKPNALVDLFKRYGKARKPFCRLHKGLHPKIVHSLFSLVALEVGIHLNRVVRHTELLRETQNDRIQRLRQMHVLWLTASVYEKTFGESSFAQKKWSWQDNECEACMITRIASDFEAVCDVRASILSRMSRKHIMKSGEPRLKVWFDLFMDNFKDHFMETFGYEENPYVFSDIVEQNKVDGLALKDLRKLIHYKKHGGKWTAKSLVAAEPALADEDVEQETAAEDSGSTTAVESSSRSRSGFPARVEDEDEDEDEEVEVDTAYDDELDIVNHYAALTSSYNVATKKSLPNNLSSTSIYSNNTFENNERVVRNSKCDESVVAEDYVSPRANWNRTQSSFTLPNGELHRKSSEKHAKSYQNLLSPHAADPGPPRTGKSGKSIWDDCSPPMSPQSFTAPVLLGNPGIVEQLLNSSEKKHKSYRASEWIPMPDAFREEMRTPPLTSSVYSTDDQQSTRQRHSRPSTLASRRGQQPTAVDFASDSSEYTPPISPISSSSESSQRRAESSVSSMSSHSRSTNSSKAPTVTRRSSSSRTSTSGSAQAPTVSHRYFGVPTPDISRFRNRALHTDADTAAPKTNMARWSYVCPQPESASEVQERSRRRHGSEATPRTRRGSVASEVQERTRRGY